MQETKFIVRFSAAVDCEIKINKKFKKFVDKCVSKFIKCNWGIISKKDKKLNRLIIKMNAEIPIVAVYKSFRYGKFIMFEDFERDGLYLSEINLDKNFEIKRNFEGINI